MAKNSILAHQMESNNNNARFHLADTVQLQMLQLPQADSREQNNYSPSPSALSWMEAVDRRIRLLGIPMMILGVTAIYILIFAVFYLFSYFTCIFYCNKIS